ncbi:MAG TPA: sarcosine oxidase subunit delta [Acidimicrobiales bacterium]|nr:sarcosine oxidase subunit delta [Acidimicrobiales bacterium]
MILIPCPHCGERNSNEFSYIGETKPRPPVDADTAEWRRYLYEKRNPAGWTTEQWFHASGCRAFFFAVRHTVSNEVRWTGLPGEPIPTEALS